ncbi:MAG: hypothetical protein HRU50_04940 [Winogradskyella sp.]|uniref:hypothetical protein n=1 Tax=Winogradskyella sp. TaxID=1883156 RepID=UPI0025D0D95B|nr:hypothetical protein [Winogradskyella sp.]NRB59273.1 hypothetical protein [Winogradskyella sp.]
MMLTLGKFLIGLIGILLVNVINNYASNEQYNAYTTVANLSNETITDSKTTAFQVLDNKCNVCHRKRNKRCVFTANNMDSWADRINTQVFVKKRMPKGKNIKLTSREYKDLQTWISSTKTSTHGI